METISKALYEAPLTQVLDLVTEGVVCLSGGTEQFDNGNSYDDSFFD